LIKIKNAINCNLPIPVAARSKAWVYGRSLAVIAGLNPAGAMDVCLLRVLCVVYVAASIKARLPIQKRPVCCVFVSKCVWSRNRKEEAY